VKGSGGYLWRGAFTGGLLASGMIINHLWDGAFEQLPGTVSVTRLVLAGALVGFGSSLGSGCTSGHGICGLARLSTRSLVHVPTFMAAGAAVACLSSTSEAIVPTTAGQMPSSRVAPLRLLSGADLVPGVALIALAAATFAAIHFLAGKQVSSQEGGEDLSKRHKALEIISETAAGLFFGLGLGWSGMTLPSKVAGFLCVCEACSRSERGARGGGASAEREVTCSSNTVFAGTRRSWAT